MPAMPIPEYRPDVATVNSNFTDTLINMFPSAGSYIPVPSMLPFTPPVPERILGCFAFRFETKVHIIVGTEKKLYAYDSPNSQWKDISREGQTYGAFQWSFAQFGSCILATNVNDKLQIFDITKDDKFRDAGGDPPRAGLVRIWGAFVALMQLTDDQRKVRWSGLYDAEHWTEGEKSSGVQVFQDGDYIQGSTESTNPLIFLRTSIYSGAFAPGSSDIFTFTKLQENLGVKGADSIASRGSNSFFISDSGFYRIGRDNNPIPIGFQKINKTIFSVYGNEALEKAHGVIDPVYDRVYWTLQLSGADQITYVYDWGLDRWTTLHAPLQRYLPIYSFGYTLDQLDDFPVPLEELDISFDNPLWYHGTPCLGAFDTKGHLGFFSGENMEATISSAEFGAKNGDIVAFNRVVAEIDTNRALLSVGSRMNRAREIPIHWGDQKEYFDRINGFNVRCRSRYHTLKLIIPRGTDWRHFTGFYVDFRPSGKW